ncbi:hypothetical protein M5K25_010710 [Dendrobium thyrsiflorum]|uniref:Transmembrane protein n=1 Tax=Dendrobium thyrsiflorum TaxID=117978 RepID=A0ABD0V7L0_DENTH
MAWLVGFYLEKSLVFMDQVNPYISSEFWFVVSTDPDWQAYWWSYLFMNVVRLAGFLEVIFLPFVVIFGDSVEVCIEFLWIGFLATCCDCGVSLHSLVDVGGILYCLGINSSALLFMPFGVMLIFPWFFFGHVPVGFLGLWMAVLLSLGFLVPGEGVLVLVCQPSWGFNPCLFGLLDVFFSFFRVFEVVVGEESTNFARDYTRLGVTYHLDNLRDFLWPWRRLQLLSLEVTNSVER